MVKSHKILIALAIVLISAIAITISAQEMCDKCKENPENCKRLKGEECDHSDCKEHIDVASADKKTIEKKIVVRMPEDNRGYLGVYTAETEKGILIEKVIPESPAEKAGMTSGMIITAINGTKVKTREELIDVLKNTKPKDEVSVVVKSGDKEKTLKVVLAEAPKTETREMKIEVKPDDYQNEDMEMPMSWTMKEMECPKCGHKMEMDMPKMKMKMKMMGECSECEMDDKDMEMCLSHMQKMAGQMPMTPEMCCPQCGHKMEMPMPKMMGKYPPGGMMKPGMKNFPHYDKQKKTTFKFNRRHAKKGRGAGYFGPGFTMFKYDDLNTLFAGHNLDSIPKQQIVFSGGGWGQVGRVRLGGFGMGGAQNVNNNDINVEIGYGAGFFELGYSLVSKKHIMFTPLLGIGGSGVSMKITSLSNSTSLDSLLNYPRGVAKVTKGGLAMYPGLAIDIPFGIAGISLKGGYIWSPMTSAWKQEEFSNIDGPDLALNGPFATLSIMFSGGK